MLGLINKIFWAARAICYRPLFGRMVLPGYIGKPIFLTGLRNIQIDKKFRIFPGARIEVTENARLIIDQDVAIAQNLHLTCGKFIHIKSGACIAANVCITDTIHDYSNPDVNVLKQKDRHKETIIGEDSFIGFGAVINAGTQLGKHCIVGANSFVNGTFPDNCVIAGNPAKIIKYYSTETSSWVHVALTKNITN